MNVISMDACGVCCDRQLFEGFIKSAGKTPNLLALNFMAKGVERLDHFQFFPLSLSLTSLTWSGFQNHRHWFLKCLCVLVLLAATVYYNIYSLYKILYHSSLSSEELYARQREVFMRKSSAAISIQCHSKELYVSFIKLQNSLDFHTSPLSP